MNRTFVPALVVALLTAGAGVTWAADAPAPSTAVKAAVADPARPAFDVSRDESRKPIESLAFAGVRPGMVVGELAAGDGYYTRVLSRTVGPKGKVYVIVSKAHAAQPGGLAGATKLAAELSNVTVAILDSTSPLPEKADLIWTAENYAGYHDGPGANIEVFNKMVFDNLKPGGVYYVEDNSAPAGFPDATSKLSRMDEAVAKKELTAAGFRIDAESDVKRNPQDKLDTVALRSNRQTDRFMLRLTRP